APATIDRPRVREHFSCAADRMTAFLAMEGDSPVGVVTVAEAVAAYAGGRYGIVSELYVDPRHRSNGVGAQLLEPAQREAGPHGWLRLEVAAPLGRRWDRSVTFYQQNGFVLTGPKLTLLL